MNTRSWLEDIYLNICCRLRWAIDYQRITSLQESELIDEIIRGMKALKEALTPPPSITCPVCGKTSYNPNDIINNFCGNCQGWLNADGKIMISDT
ncbi:MAG: hypothetical protein HWQ38_18875 [Nostoc sp. NMS7]|uniref:hypothetical protein n=1 Tax=Nostoc sp. NMS7 TaxID=2815391 RepID=UPI0025EB54A5|nr:hypothetical protein [Nostoc sp. NMS7]MBN3948400.1 hypothetical protein [Nostoc sp. NMS7]